MRHNFVWSACRDNIYSFVQIASLFGQLPQQLAARSNADSILKPHLGSYCRPLNNDPEDADLHGVCIYMDTNKLRSIHSMLAWDKTFAGTHAANKSKSKTSCTSNFIKRYPFQEPPSPELGGWDGTFPCLELCIGIGINKAENKDYLLQERGAFIWSD